MNAFQKIVAGAVIVCMFNQGIFGENRIMLSNTKNVKYFTNVSNICGLFYIGSATAIDYPNKINAGTFVTLAVRPITYEILDPKE